MEQQQIEAVASAPTITIPVTEEWNHMFQPSALFARGQRPFRRRVGRDDFVTYSEAYSNTCREPVWFYSWGNSIWLKCPIGCPGDHLNAAGDRIASVEVTTVNGEWAFVVFIEEAKQWMR